MVAVDWTDAAPVLGALRVQNGVAGQFSITVDVSYPDEPTVPVSFVGYAGDSATVVMLSNGHQTFVKDPGRFGSFGQQWVRRFFA